MPALDRLQLLTERGYEVLSPADITDARAGMLCRAMGRLVEQSMQKQLQIYNDSLPKDCAYLVEEIMAGRERQVREAKRKDQDHRTGVLEALRTVMNFANGHEPVQRGGAHAVFEADKPRLFIAYEDRNGDAVSVTSLYGFDDFGHTETGATVAREVVTAVTGGNVVAGTPSTLGSMPDDFLRVI